AGRLVNRVITRDASRLGVGRVWYTPWCDEEGKVVDDGTVTRVEESAYRWTAAHPNLRWLAASSRGLDVEVQDISESVAALALQGPTSRALLAGVAGTAVEALKYFHVASAEIAGVPVE